MLCASCGEPLDRWLPGATRWRVEVMPADVSWLLLHSPSRPCVRDTVPSGAIVCSMCAGDLCMCYRIEDAG